MVDVPESDLEELVKEWRSERDNRDPNTLTNIHCLAKEEAARELEELIE